MSMFKTFFCLVLVASCAEQESRLELAGTKGRLEQEYKASFSTTENIDQITKLIQTELFNLIINKNLEVPKKLDNQYFLSGKLSPYIFVDYYLDDKKMSLLHNDAIYRLRYRWKEEQDYLLFSDKYKAEYYPIRAEVQAKTKIKISKNDLASSLETRFEFRDGSHPFIGDQKAPSAPWALSDYLNISQNGRYKNFNLRPYRVIMDEYKPSHLVPRYIIKTARRRFHLNIKNKWGSGPNPHQAFIITVDHFSYKPFLSIIDGFKNNFKKEFFEIEVEFERNTSTKLLEDTRPYVKSVISAFRNDQAVMFKTLKDILLQSHVKMNKTSSKLKRVYEDSLKETF